MKNFLSLFFTTPAKAIYILLLFICSLLYSNTHINYITLYNEDKESFVNAITQLNSFDFESSYYLKNTVKQSVEDVVKLSMEYDKAFEKGATLSELLSHYASIGDKSFSEICENLSRLKGFRFAVINHDKHKIYSNITEINGKKSTVNIRKYFGETGNTLLIARSCKNPYFATSTFVDFAEHIRGCAEKYEDNFDLYISFGSQESFLENEAKYEKLHFAMREKIEKLTRTVAVYMLLIPIIIIILLIVTGKHELGGKTYGSIMNRLPNDLIVLMYSICLICLFSLYRTTSSMLITHGTELEEIWFTHSYDFYISRINFCIVAFIFLFTGLACILKRQYKMGSLFKNTYISTIIRQKRRLKITKDTTETTE